MFSNEPSGFQSGFNFMSSIFPYLFVGVLVIILISLILRSVRYVKNASSPRKSFFVKVVAKRTYVDHHASSSFTNGNAPSPSPSMHHSHTYYYITLEFENGERVEYLDVKGLYGLVAEGDCGYASIQGDWIVAFERRSSPSFYS